MQPQNTPTPNAGGAVPTSAPPPLREPQTPTSAPHVTPSALLSDLAAIRSSLQPMQSGMMTTQPRPYSHSLLPLLQPRHANSTGLPTSTPTSTTDTIFDEPKKKRGRPKGSRNRFPRAGSLFATSAPMTIAQTQSPQAANPGSNQEWIASLKVLDIARVTIPTVMHAGNEWAITPSPIGLCADACLPRAQTPVIPPSLASRPVSVTVPSPANRTSTPTRAPEGVRSQHTNEGVSVLAGIPGQEPTRFDPGTTPLVLSDVRLFRNRHDGTDQPLIAIAMAAGLTTHQPNPTYANLRAANATHANVSSYQLSVSEPISDPLTSIDGKRKRRRKTDRGPATTERNIGGLPESEFNALVRQRVTEQIRGILGTIGEEAQASGHSNRIPDLLKVRAMDYLSKEPLPGKDTALRVPTARLALLLRCGVCLHFLDSPVSLPCCTKRVCQSCAAKYTQNNRICCPLCGGNTSIRKRLKPDKDVEAIVAELVHVIQPDRAQSSEAESDYSSLNISPAPPTQKGEDEVLTPRLTLPPLTPLSESAAEQARARIIKPQYVVRARPLPGSTLPPLSVDTLIVDDGGTVGAVAEHIARALPSSAQLPAHEISVFLRITSTISGATEYRLAHSNDTLLALKRRASVDGGIHLFYDCTPNPVTAQAINEPVTDTSRQQTEEQATQSQDRTEQRDSNAGHSKSPALIPVA